MNLTAEQIETIRNRILDFDDWVWCDCAECKQDPRSYAIDTNASLEKIANATINFDNKP